MNCLISKNNIQLVYSDLYIYIYFLGIFRIHLSYKFVVLKIIFSSNGLRNILVSYIVYIEQAGACILLFCWGMLGSIHIHIFKV